MGPAVDQRQVSDHGVGFSISVQVGDQNLHGVPVREGPGGASLPQTWKHLEAGGSAADLAGLQQRADRLGAMSGPWGIIGRLGEKGLFAGRAPNCGRRPRA